jgi:hypothetical protein
MFRSTLLKGFVILAVALAATVRIEEQRLHEARKMTAAVALQAMNMVAERDSTRDVAAANASVAALLGDSLRVVERQVMQVVQRRDALDRGLGGERRARYLMKAAVDSLRMVAFGVSAPVLEDGVRRASFEVRRVPYTVEAEVEIPALPDTARMELRVALDPIPVEARVSCSSPNEQGLRRASVAATTPVWATLRFERVEQSPDLCASSGLHASSEVGKRGFRLRPFVGVGRVVSSGGGGIWGLIFGFGYPVWAG